MDRRGRCRSTCTQPAPDGGNFVNCRAYRVQIHVQTSFTDRDPVTFDCDSDSNPNCGVPLGAECPGNCSYTCAPDGMLLWPDGTTYTEQYPSIEGVTYTFSCANYNCVIQYQDFPREPDGALCCQKPDGEWFIARGAPCP